MRDYLYIWDDKVDRRIVTSGIEFCDFSKSFSYKGLILLDHEFKYCKNDGRTGLDFVQDGDVELLLKEDIYRWGDFCWVDYRCSNFLNISKHELAELLYFGHTKSVLGSVCIESLGNRFICHQHDDGWLTSLYYDDFADIYSLLKTIIDGESLDKIDGLLKSRDGAALFREGEVLREETTFNIDRIIRKFNLRK